MSERLLASLSSVFGAIATLLAAIGLYGVMAYMVARRTREIGIRMALGARSWTVVWLVLREVILLASIGIAIGLAGSLAVTRLVQPSCSAYWPRTHSRWPEGLSESVPSPSWRATFPRDARQPSIP